MSFTPVGELMVGNSGERAARFETVNPLFVLEGGVTRRERMQGKSRHRWEMHKCRHPPSWPTPEDTFSHIDSPNPQAHRTTTSSHPKTSATPVR